MKLLATAGVAAFLLTACHEFRADLTGGGRCGNHVVEPAFGEDCDTDGPAGTQCGDAASERACLYICAATPECPNGWSCGLDGVCRAPSSQFDEPVVITIGGNSFRVGDVDGDKREDLVAFATAELMIGYGDVDGKFGRIVPFRVASYEGPSTGDINGDGLLDVAVPQSNGIMIAIGQRSRQLSPVSMPTVVSETGMHNLRAIPVRTAEPYIRHHTLGLFGSTAGLSVTVLEAGGGTNAENATSAMTGMSTRFTEKIDVADLDGGGTADEVAIASEEGDRVVVLSVGCTGAQMQLACTAIARATVLLPASYVVGRHGPLFADTRGDGFLDLLISMNGSSGSGGAIAVAEGRGDGTFAPAMIDPDLTAALACQFCPSEGASLVDAADLDGDDIADYVTELSVFVTTSTSPITVREVARAETPWRTAFIAELNGDESLDVAGIRPTGIDILISAGDGLFNTRQANVSPAPSALATGDFDGDLYPDLALVEGTDTISILYGDADAPVVVAEIDRIASIAPMLSGVNAVDRITDLVVTTLGEDGDEYNAVIHLTGSSARRMLAPVVFPGHGDTLAVARLDDDRFADVLIQSNAGGVAAQFLLRGSEELGVTPPEVERLVQESCATDQIRSMVIENADLDRDGEEELLILTTPPPAVPDSGAYALKIFDLEGSTLRCISLDPAREVGGVVQLAVADLDGDGALDAIAGFDPTMRTERPQMEGIRPAVAVWWGKTSAPYFEAAPFVSHMDRSLALLTVAELDGDDTREIVFVDPSGVGIAEVATRGEIQIHAERVILDRGVGLARILQKIDADGDGLDDIAVGTSDELFLLRQKACTAQRAAQGQCSRRTE